ncbi:MAG: 3-hydroxyacyl-ACP dehydratase FabZ [Ruminococcaceae bacterium]|nr:3-hydroxyacyl-ACP dehydratase FabZ [Oscillospiraceae bacterium]
MNIEEIKAILPHRDNMLLLDSAEIVDGFACGKKEIKGDEWFLKGHFPDNPVVPGVILCEILAQSVCVLMNGKLGENQLPFFTGLDKVKFKRPVKPGDVFETKCEITKEREPFYFAKGTGSVNGKVCVSAEFSFAVTEK